MLKLSDLIRVGIELGVLRESDEVHPGHVLASMNILSTRLPELGLNQAAVTLKAVESLENVLKHYAAVFRTKNQTDANLRHLWNAANTVVDVAMSEASTVSLVVVQTHLLNDGFMTLPRRLGFLAVTEALHRDVVSCVQTAAWRPAAVMGWNMAFDALRHWVFDDEERREKFNSDSKQDSITEYEEFFLITERRILDRIHGASLLPSKRHRFFLEWLDYRNDLAHANFRQPSQASVVGKLHELAEQLIETLG